MYLFQAIKSAHRLGPLERTRDLELPSLKFLGLPLRPAFLGLPVVLRVGLDLSVLLLETPPVRGTLAVPLAGRLGRAHRGSHRRRKGTQSLQPLHQVAKHCVIA